jgi:hypothetical protein
MVPILSILVSLTEMKVIPMFIWTLMEVSNTINGIISLKLLITVSIMYTLEIDKEMYLIILLKISVKEL